MSAAAGARKPGGAGIAASRTEMGKPVAYQAQTVRPRKPGGADPGCSIREKELATAAAPSAAQLQPADPRSGIAAEARPRKPSVGAAPLQYGSQFGSAEILELCAGCIWSHLIPGGTIREKELPGARGHLLWALLSGARESASGRG